MKQSVKPRIENQLNKIFDELSSCYSTKISFILSKLDLSELTLNTQSQFPLPSIMKLYIFKRVKAITKYEDLEEHFKQNKQEAHSIGLCNDTNNQLIFPKKRIFNWLLQTKIGKEIKIELDKVSERILELACKNKIILDLVLVKKTLKEKTDSKKELREAVKLVKKLVYPQIDIPINHNAKFTTKDLLDILVHIALTHDFCNNGSRTFKELYPEIQSPSGDTLLYHFSKLKSRDQLEETFKSVFDVIFNFAKKNYNILNRKVDLAIDIHDVPYYGNKSDPFVIGGKQDRGTNHFFKFITCSIVMAGRRFTIDTLPMHNFDITADLVDKLLKRAKSKVHIRHVYLDRGFDNAAIIKVLKQNKIKFLMPKIRNNPVKEWYDKSEDCKARVIENYKIRDESVTLVLVDDEDGIKRAFSTNIKISEPIAHYLFKLYKARWGIETSYRQMEHDFKARTTSKKYNIRLFYFLFSVCLYNLWVLVNICVSLKLFGRVRDKPIITSKLFVIVLYRVSIDPGG